MPQFFGKCAEYNDDGSKCRFRIVVSDETHKILGSVAVNMEAQKRELCPDHGNSMFFKGVKYTHSPATHCDAKCRLSVSEICKCSCGGAEHGRGSIARYK